MGASVKLSRATRALGERSFKGAEFAAGTIIQINSVEEKDLPGANGSTLIGDVVKCTIDNKAYNMPLSEFMRLKTENGGSLITAKEGDSGALPEKVEIKKSEPRQRDGKDMYTAASYKGFDVQNQIHGNDFAKYDWEKVYASELKDNPRKIMDHTVIELS